MTIQQVHVPFTQGQEQSLDARILPAGLWQRAQNVRFGKGGRIESRGGLDTTTFLTTSATTPVGNPQALCVRDDKLVYVSDQRVYEYDSTLDRYRDRGQVPVFSAPEVQRVSRDLDKKWRRCGVATAGGYTVVISAEDGTAGELWAHLYNESTGVLLSETQLTTTCGHAAVVCADGSGTRIGVFWVDNAYTKVWYSILDTTASSPSMGAPVNAGVAFDCSATSVGGLAVCPNTVNATGWFSVHVDSATGQLVVHKHSTSGASSAGPLSWAPANTAIDCAIVDDGTRVYVAYVNYNSGTSDYALKFNTVNALVTATIATNVAVENVGTAAYGGAQGLGRPAGLNNAGTVSFYWNYGAQTLTGPVSVHYATCSSSAVAGTIRVRSGCALAGAPFLYSGTVYAPLVSYGVTFRTYAICSLANSGTEPFPVHAVFGGGLGLRSGLLTDNVWATASTSGDVLVAIPVVSRGLIDTSVYSQPSTAIELYRFAKAGQDKNRPLGVAGNVYLSGGVGTVYDGSTVREAGFNQTPECISVVEDAAAGGMTATQTYQYCVVFERTDADGNVYRSPVSNVVSVTLGAGKTSAVLTFTDYKLGSTKLSTTGRIVAHVYRTTGNGTVFYRRTAEGGGVACLGITDTATTLTYTDSNADPTYDTDTELSASEPLYTLGGAFLENDVTTGYRYQALAGQRMWIAGLGDPNEARCSRRIVRGEPVEFVDDDVFRVVLPEPITALASMDGLPIFFTATSVYTVSGDGPDDSGQGSLGEPRRLPSPVGCSDYRGLLEFHEGLLFRSPRGLELLPRGFGEVVWQSAVRDDVATFSNHGQPVAYPEENVLMFPLLTSNGYLGTFGATLVYDYAVRAWSLDVVDESFPVQGLARTSDHLYLLGQDAANAVWIRRRSEDFLDVAADINCRLLSGEIRVSGLTGFNRLRSVELLGEARSEGTLDLRGITYGGSSNTDAVSFSVPNSPGEEVRFEYGPSRQKCEAITLDLTWTAETVALNGMTLNVEVLQGSGRLHSGVRR